MELTLGKLRRYKDEEVLRIAIHDIAGTLPLQEVMGQLTALAQSCLERCLALAEEEAAARGRLPPGRLCVVGMGKLGGREIGYHSDVDLVFLYSGGPASRPPGPPGPPLATGQPHPADPALARAASTGEEHALYARLAQRLLSFLQLPLREGVLYKADTRLRPSGNQGALVTSVEGFARYHLGGETGVTSQLWERQALLRARLRGG